MKEFTIGPNEAGQRFDKYLGKLLHAASMGFVFKMLRKKNITLNGKKAAGNEILTVGDKVKLFLSDDTFDKFSANGQAQQNGKTYTVCSETDLNARHLRIVYEDEDILVFDKPAGMLSQKATEADVSVNEYLIGYLLFQKELNETNLATFRPSIANRLDRNTSGLILCGKTLRGLQYLAEIIKNRSLGKYYRCLVEGTLSQKLLIDGYMVKDTRRNKVSISETPVKDGEDAAYIKTGIYPIGQYKWHNKYYTELSVHLITGKPHQIRAHLASVGHPLLGDCKYGNRNILTDKFHIKGQLLHAYKVIFPPSNGAFAYLSGKELTAPLPPVYEKILKELQNGNVE